MNALPWSLWITGPRRVVAVASTGRCAGVSVSGAAAASIDTLTPSIQRKRAQCVT